MPTEILYDNDCDFITHDAPFESIRGDAPTVAVSANRIFAFKPHDADGQPLVQKRLLNAWVYSSTLMQTRRPIYQVPALHLSDLTEDQLKQLSDKQEDLSTNLSGLIASNSPVALPAINNLLTAEILPDDQTMESAASFAEANGDLELAIAVRARFIPLGRCSVDTLPQDSARRYAELCHRAGNLPCFLNLQVQIMGDSFERVAYSSIGEASHATEANALRDIGIDVGKFLKGLTVQFSAPGISRAEIGPWRLARSILESGSEEDLLPFLEQVALDPQVDNHNRLRATQVWSFLLYLMKEDDQRHPSPTPDRRQQVFQALNSLAVSSPSRSWLSTNFGRD